MAKKQKKKKRTQKKRSPSSTPHRFTRPDWQKYGLGDWTTDEILQRLKEYGLDMNEALYRRDAEHCRMASAMAEIWIKRAKVHTGLGTDFLHYSARDLWRRFIPERDCLETLEEDLLPYIRRDDDDAEAAQPHNAENKVAGLMRRLDRVDAWLAQTAQIENDAPEADDEEPSHRLPYVIQLWLLALPWELHHDGCGDEAAAVARRYSFLDPENMLADLSLILAENGRCQEALAQVEENLKTYADDPWVVLTAGEVRDRCDQPQRALELYLKAYEMLDDPYRREDVCERLIPLYERLGMEQEKKALEDRQRRDLEEEADAELREMETAADSEPEAAPVARPFGKVGRNAPCPCGSGKKYKKCCLDKR